MASTISGILSQKSPDGEEYNPVSRLAGFGAIIGLVAAAIGLFMSNGTPLVPIPSIGALILKNPTHFWASGAFMGVLSIGILIQAIGSKQLRNYLGSGYANISYIVAIIGIVTAILVIQGGLFWNTPGAVASYVVNLMTLGSFFVICWQLMAVFYVDSDKTWIGFLAGILNGMFIPILAVGQVLGSSMILFAYLVLIGGQLFSVLFWWAPMNNLREYARSPPKAKTGFALAGFLTFLLGAVAVFIGPIVAIEDVEIWTPWTAMADATTFLTDPVLIFGLLASMLFWIMLSPRLGARELKEAQIGDDIVKGGSKYLMVFLALFGLFAAGQAGSMVADIVPGFTLFLTWCPAAIMFLMGARYAGNTDLIVGIPLVITSVFIMIHPFVLPIFVLIPWIMVIITQGFLIVEASVRGLTSFSQTFLTVIVTVIASGAFIFFILGGFGSGPAAIWPVNNWFPIAFFGNIPVAVQTGTVLALPILALLIRNVTLVGYAHGRNMAGADILGAMSVLFALLVPIIGDPTATVSHKALTAASIMLALYAISFVLVLSLNLNLAGEVEDTDNPYEGMLVRIVTIAGIILGSIVAVIVLGTFSGFPSTTEIAFVITLLVTLVVGLEILNLLSWLIIGVRLGMLKGGWRFTRI